MLGIGRECGMPSNSPSWIWPRRLPASNRARYDRISGAVHAAMIYQIRYNVKTWQRDPIRLSRPKASSASLDLGTGPGACLLFREVNVLEPDTHRLGATIDGIQANLQRRGV